MELQFHPASPSGRVRSFVLDARRERAAVALAGLACAAALSLWISVPTYALRAARRERAAAILAESVRVRRLWRDLEDRARASRDRALDAGALVSRIAFLSSVSPAGWPRSLNPESGVLAGKEEPAAIAQGLGRYLAGLERGLALVEERAAAEPALALATPSILPIASDLVEPSALFGPRVSPWTGADEFFTGLDLAAPAGSAVIAPADGVVAFAGRITPTPGSRLWRYGNCVVLSHGSGAATFFGHLGKIEVRRGQRVRRGERLGSVGSSGWAISPTLHYEFWRRGAGDFGPTDPRFAILDRKLAGRDVSLEKMWATSAPGPLEALPELRR